VPGGYYEDMNLDEKLQIFSRIRGLDGLVIFYPTDPLPKNPTSLKKKLSNHNLRISILEPESWSDPKWKNGAFSTGDRFRLPFSGRLPGRLEIFDRIDSGDRGT
jgi:hypothetical protein